MRITNSDNFGTRPSKEMLEKRKYFLIYEGELTEPMYFGGIIDNQNRLAISQSLSIISVLRSIEDSHNSHPKHVFALAKEIIETNQERIITSKNLKKCINDFIEMNEAVDKDKKLQAVEEYFAKYANNEIYLYELYNILVDIFKIDIFSDLVEKVLKYLNEQMNLLDYNPEIDKINLIIDRDKNSFKDFQYDSLLADCREKNISLYVSNPSFEVWLLMHFVEFDTLDFDKLLENKRVGKGKKARKYADKMLSEISGYDKTNLHFSNFIDKVDDAIEREKKYCEDIEGLKFNVGSNVGILISKLRNNK